MVCSSFCSNNTLGIGHLCAWWHYRPVTVLQGLLCSAVFQLKNASTVLEYEKIAEVDFEKRDFRKVRLT